ncbi:MAG: lytic transglycosylase domain-containing protein [Patescibacteria group bacterium]|nr:lytic transglycosylase domain-containing protein [Patescibacteria group bacterium]
MSESESPEIEVQLPKNTKTAPWYLGLTGGLLTCLAAIAGCSDKNADAVVEPNRNLRPLNEVAMPGLANQADQLLQKYEPKPAPSKALVMKQTSVKNADQEIESQGLPQAGAEPLEYTDTEIDQTIQEAIQNDDNLQGYKADHLFNIYSEGVMQHQDLIYQLSKEFDIPPNLIAILMDVESDGIESSESPVGAQGLFQVMPFNFDPEIQNHPELMKDPLINGRAAMKYFKRMLDLASQATELYPEIYGGINPDNTKIYPVRAFMNYNGGETTMGMRRAELPEETEGYRAKVFYRLKRVEVAKKLEDRGFSPEQISEKVSALEIPPTP